MEIVYHTFLVFARVDYYLVALSKSEFFLKPLAEAKQRRCYTGGSETGSAGRHITQATQTCRSLIFSNEESINFRVAENAISQRACNAKFPAETTINRRVFAKNLY